jgi:hypothetical protein
MARSVSSLPVQFARSSMMLECARLASSNLFFNGLKETMKIVTLLLAVNTAAWVAHWWAVNDRLKGIEAKQLRILADFEGLRVYLYEIDPQFDDERALQGEWTDTAIVRDPFREMELLRAKRQHGKRTLSTRFSS